MCQSKAEGGRRCACSGTYTPKVAATRKSNSDYRKALASAVRRKGLDNLAERVGTASFTAMPELTKAAGLDPSEVSSAPLPGTVKRHSVGQDDKELISELETAATETVASPDAAENVGTAGNDGETATPAEGGDGDSAGETGEGAEAAHDNIFQMNVEELTARRDDLNQQMERLDNRIAAAEERGRFNTADMLNDKYAELADEASTIDSLIEMRENGQLVDTVPVLAASDGEDGAQDDGAAQGESAGQTADDAQSDDTAQSETAEETMTPEDGRTREEKVGAEKDADKGVLQAYDANNYDKHVGQAAEAISKFTGEENTDIQTMHEAADAIVELGKTGLTRGDGNVTPGDAKSLIRAVKAEAAHVRRAEACADEADRIYSMLRHSERETDNARSEDVLAATKRILPDHNPMGRGKSISSTSAAEMAQSMLDNTYSTNGYDRAQLFARYSPSDFEAEKKLVDGENYRTYHAGYAATERYSIDHAGNVNEFVDDEKPWAGGELFEVPEICHTPLTRTLDTISQEESTSSSETLGKVREAINSASQEDVDSLVNSAWATAQENLDYTATNYMEMSNDDEKHRFEVWHASVNEEIDRLADAARAGRRDNVVELLALAHMAGEAPVDDDPDTASSAAPAGVEPLFDL